MVLLIMKLVMLAMKRKLIICSPYKNGFQTNGFFISYHWWWYTIKKWNKEFTIDEDTLPVSTIHKEFNKLLKEFLTENL